MRCIIIFSSKTDNNLGVFRCQKVKNHKNRKQCKISAFKAYNNLEHHGYFHGVVNHFRNFKDPYTGVPYTNTIESNWRPLKYRIERGGVEATDRLAQHLFEYLWIRSHKKNKDIFCYSLKLCQCLVNKRMLSIVFS